MQSENIKGVPVTSTYQMPQASRKDEIPFPLSQS